MKWKGIALAPGVAVGRAFLVQSRSAPRPNQSISDPSEVELEQRRFDQSCATSLVELHALAVQAEKQLGAESAAIFRAHALLLEDPLLLSKVKSLIVEKSIRAENAVELTREEFAQMFNRIQDPVLQERMADVNDVFNRLLSHLGDEQAAPPEGDEPLILVSQEILPSMAGRWLEKGRFCAILTESGGSTGHGAILARSLGIPAITGLRNLLKNVHSGSLLVVDAREGLVVADPGPEALGAYRKMVRENASIFGRLVENRDRKSVTADGRPIELLANVNNAADARMATASGAAGVGLYRTEYLFLTHPTVPDEEEQIRVYREVIDASPGRKTVLRTLDLGGDKQVPLHGQIQILFPMVSHLEELRHLRREVRRCMVDLARRGVPHADSVPLGVLVEVPSAAFTIRQLLGEADFVSIGTNDLIQYFMAADRDNPQVAHLCEPFNPAVFRLLHHVVKACVSAGKPVTLCGEMAGRPRCLLPLLGMGITRLSMTPAVMPTVREAVSRTRLETCGEILRRVKRFRTFAGARRYLTKATLEVLPDLEIIDT
jgi:phosphoenolpyruvate-protein kinase (PTS system EI component)